ncbi:serine/threonine protein kinase [Variovorax sp. ZT5P49]|uniref:serine/threonine protein kinase n=1 Tax=Variovorax sp. ZT5P49 TaxID=3443733 RepID=UPI003F45B45B
MKFESPLDIWVDAASFEERWDVLDDKVGQGGQGVGHRVIRKGNQQVAFVKVIQEKSGISRERRARFYGEAQAYLSLQGLQVPSLIETNAHRHEDKSVELYIATEFIEGANMRSWRNRTKQVTLDQATAITLLLLDTVARAHAVGILHRDIKPENIIMRDGEMPSPVLVDFGLAFDQSNDERQTLTREGDELGNRFLSLPELNGGSDDKRNPASDLTTIAGIFYYLFTGRNPTQLSDGYGRLPHQREKAQQFFAGFERSGIRNFFDKAFAPAINDRYQTSELMKTELRKILTRHSEPEPADRTERLHRILGGVALQSSGKRSVRVREALQWAMRAYSGVANQSHGSMTAQQVDIRCGIEIGHVRIRWDFKGEYWLCTYLWVEVSGRELVWYTSHGEVYRARMNTQLEDESLDTIIKNAVEADMLRILEEDLADIPAEFSGLHALRDRLTYSLESAIERSRDMNLPIFAIVYDETQPMGHRENLLDRVLGEHAVQILISNFVLLVIAKSSAQKHIQIPAVGDYCAVIRNGQWTRPDYLAMNREATRTYLSNLQETFAHARHQAP